MLKPNEPITPVEIIAEGRGCGYRGFRFGSFAIDGECVDGTMQPLFRAGDGFGYTGDIAPSPCPFCDRRAYLKWRRPQAFRSGFNSAAQGFPIDSCPFPSIALFPKTADELRTYWLEGWLAYVELHGERGSEVPVRGAACLEAAA